MPKEDGSRPAAQAGRGGGGDRLKVTRKNFAVTGAKEIVCSGALPPERLATRWKFWPSSLASRFFSGAAIPAIIAEIKSGSFVTKVIARIVCGCANSY